MDYKQTKSNKNNPKSLAESSMESSMVVPVDSKHCGNPWPSANRSIEMRCDKNGIIFDKNPGIMLCLILGSRPDDKEYDCLPKKLV